MNLLNQKGIDKWQGVGVYPTPFNLLDEFSEFVLSKISRKMNPKNNPIELLDIFSGDGRIGKSVSKIIESRSGVNVNVTFIEAMIAPLELIERKPNFTILNQNVFESKLSKKYELVVSNPPYLVLNSNTSESLGIDWDLAKKYSKNLYALSILKGLEMCSDNGVLVVIAPFGYLRGYESFKFKEKIEEECSEVIIKASPLRTLFEGVNQDIGFQCFYKRSKGDKSPTYWSFGYNGHEASEIKKQINIQPLNSNGSRSKLKVRVGPIVWNRSKDHLIGLDKKETNCALIYGANIRHNGELDLNVKKLSNRQFIKSSGMSNGDLIKENAILIRRTLRGSPGKWIVDSTIIMDRKQAFTAENHVIVVELKEANTYEELDSFRRILCERIEDYYSISGSPTISTKIVESISRNI